MVYLSYTLVCCTVAQGRTRRNTLVWHRKGNPNNPFRTFPRSNVTVTQIEAERLRREEQEAEEELLRVMLTKRPRNWLGHQRVHQLHRFLPEIKERRRNCQTLRHIPRQVLETFTRLCLV